MHLGNTTALPGSTPRADPSFQKLLLEFATAAASGRDTPSLIRLFLRSTREFFGVDGTYFWKIVSRDEMVGTDADGHMAESFPGLRMQAGESAVAAESVRRRHTVF